MRRTLQNQEFASSLGKSLPPPRTGGSKLGYLNKYKMIQDFRDAPASNLGGGLGISFQEVEWDSEPSPHEILSIVKHNAGIIKAQGGLTAQNKPSFIRQVNSLTSESFGGDRVALKEAKQHYLLLTNSSLGGVFTYDNPQTSLKNWQRVIGTALLYIGIPATAIYFVGSRAAKRNNPAAIVARLTEEE